MLVETNGAALTAAEANLAPESARRARHVVEEIARVAAARTALEGDDHFRLLDAKIGGIITGRPHPTQLASEDRIVDDQRAELLAVTAVGRHARFGVEQALPIAFHNRFHGGR